MKAPIQYLEHVGIMAEHYGNIAGERDDKEVAEHFEAIYDAALDVDYGEAKKYLAGLDSGTMETIRKFHHLADDINVGSLDEEGAYNLLVHRYEQLDFNGDGLIQSGAADLISLFPQDMSNDIKQGLVKTVGEMQDEGFHYFRDISPILMQLHFQFDPHIRERLIEGARGMDNVQAVTPELTFQALQEMQERLHHPTGGMVVSDAYVKKFDRFMEILEGVLSESGADAAPAEKKSEAEDPQIASFFDRVRAAGGALSFIQQLNLEKIEKLIEEKRKELEGKMGLNAEPPLPEEQRLKIIEEIEELLEQYKKDLLEAMEKRSKTNTFDEDDYLKLLINTNMEGKEKPVDPAPEIELESDENRAVNS